MNHAREFNHFSEKCEKFDIQLSVLSKFKIVTVPERGAASFHEKSKRMRIQVSFIRQKCIDSDVKIEYSVVVILVLKGIAANF